jgi:hypothetical protein
MTRLDRHVSAVQSKMFLRRFIDALAWASMAWAGLILLGVVIDKLFQVIPAGFPTKWVIWIGAGFCVVGAAVWSFVNRANAVQAATAIDERLRLKERFSTAMYLRGSSDPFAQAAVRDAELTAQRVNLAKQFPLSFPKPVYTTMGMVLAAFLLAQFVQPLNLFGRQQTVTKKAEDAQSQAAAKENVERALAAVESMPKSQVQNEEFRKLVAELQEFNKASRLQDPSKANRRALQALQEVNNQTAKEWDKAKKYAEAQNAMMQALQPPDDAKGPVGEARKEIAKGNFDQAANILEEATKKFDQMDQKQKEDAAKQMEQAAQQLQQLANNPQVQQQLQQMGANQQQAQQMQNLMQQAAQGGQKGQQAAQQLQQMAQQMMQQMNNGQGPNAQQQQQMQQAMQQMQAQANAQNQANALAQAAQQMAQAMQQGAQQQQQQGNGGQQNPQQGQQMQQAQAQMKQALQNMQGVKQDLNQMLQQAQANAQQAQQNLQNGQQCANGQCNGQGQGQQQGQQAGNGQWNQGNPQNKGNGMGQAGIGQGGVAQKETSPFGTKSEQSPSKEDENGRILARYMVKDQALKGEQKMQMAKVVADAQKEAADEVDSEHASRQSREVAKKYFGTMSEESGTAAKEPAQKK